MCFNREEGRQLDELLDKYGFDVRIETDEDENETFVLYQDIMRGESLGEVLAWIIMEFEEK